MKKTLILFLTFICSHFAYPQKSEIGAFAGTSFYLGDLNPTTLFANPQFSGGLIYRYNFDPRWALKANIIFGNIKAGDAENNDGYERNLSFHSPITEISAQVELNFLKLYNIPSKNHFAPYIFTGLSVFSFNPQAQLNGINYDLQHLGTEGQGLDGEPDFYSLTAMAIPFGIGIKFNIGRYISVGAEWGMRYTFTDYLDDVSGNYYDNSTLAETRGDIVAALADRSEVIHVAGTGRGNYTTKDLYSFAGATFTFKIGNEDKTCDLHYKPDFHRKLGKKR
jgi:hypothetical protein